MYVITGITGAVGAEVARHLLKFGQPVRGVVRDGAKGQVWAGQGCEIAVADLTDTEALTKAFEGAEAVFILPPPVFDPQPGYPEARAVAAAVTAALKAAGPKRVVHLSTIGADAVHDNLLSQHTIIETSLSDPDLPVAFLRSAWFIDNAAWDVSSARDTGVIHSFLQSTDRAIAMVARSDVGRVAAELMQQTWQGQRIIELEGPRRVSPDDLALVFADIFGRPVHAEPVARDSWEALFRAQSMANPQPRISMLDGFNAGWIDFSGKHETIRGRIDAREVIAGLVKTALMKAAK